VKETSGSRVTIDKKYSLSSPNTKPAFELSGGGPLVFDSQQGLFVSCSLNYELKVKDENVEIRVPITVEYKLMSAQDIAAADQQQREAAAKAAEAAMTAARAQFAGLSEEQISEIYHRTGVLVPPTGRVITPEMRLPKGLLIQNQWPSQYKWTPAKVVRELPDGQVEFESVETKKLYQRDRSTLFLAPDFVDQPYVSSAELAAFRRQLGGGTPDTPSAPEFRTWQDASGNFSVEAKFLRVDGEQVVLHRKKDDREIKVPLKLLSPADQKFIAEQNKKGEANPFE
jgi:hypothetical protein